MGARWCHGEQMEAWEFTGQTLKKALRQFERWLGEQPYVFKIQDFVVGQEGQDDAGFDPAGPGPFFIDVVVNYG